MASSSSSSSTPSYYNSRCSLPSAWEPRVTGMRNQHAMQYLKVDGTRVRYVGPGEEDAQAATVRTNYPVPTDCPLYYFEVTVLDRGQDCFIGVGFCTDEVVLSRLPGWDPHSYGFHGDDGNAFSGSGTGRPFGPTYTTGDTVGALYDKASRTISYYKNGAALGEAFREVAEAAALFPCVGLRTRGEEVSANFGTGAGGPFVTDFLAAKAALSARVLRAVRDTPLPLLSPRGAPLLPSLLVAHLLHQRYARTAAVLRRDLLRGSEDGGSLGEAELSDIAARQAACELVAEGAIDEALTLLQQRYPAEVLSERPSLDFRLRVQKFVELAAASAAAAARQPQQQQPQQQQPQQQQPQQQQPANGHATSASASASVAAPSDAAAAEAAGGKAAGGGPPAAAAAAVTGDAPPTAAVPTTREILEYGTSELWPRCRTAADRELLTDALSLLAFDDPATCPAAYLLRPSHRLALAEELNGAMLAVRGQPPASPLERLYQQAAAVLSELKRTDHPQALAIPDARALILDPPQQPPPTVQQQQQQQPRPRPQQPQPRPQAAAGAQGGAGGGVGGGREAMQA